MQSKSNNWRRKICAVIAVFGMLCAGAGIAAAQGKADRLSGFYIGALGQFTHARAEFQWNGREIFDTETEEWGVGGVLGYGWLFGNFYVGPEIYLDYMDISNRVTASPIDPDIASLKVDREVGAGLNLLLGFTAFDNNALFYGLIGGGATNVDGAITLNSIGSVEGDIWYPVLTVGAGVDIPVSDVIAVRLQAKHTFYFDASDMIFERGSNNSYDLDTTTASIGIIFRP